MPRAVAKLPKSNELVDWILDQLQPRGPFRSPREWSRRIGRGHNYVTSVLETGRATPEGLIDLADSVGASRVEILRKAGWLREEDIRSELSPEQTELVETYQMLPPQRRGVLLEVARSLRAQTLLEHE